MQEVGGLHYGCAAGDSVGAVLKGFAGGDAGLAGGHAVSAAEAFVYYCGLRCWSESFGFPPRADCLPGMAEPLTGIVRLRDSLLASRSLVPLSTSLRSRGS